MHSSYNLSISHTVLYLLYVYCVFLTEEGHDGGGSDAAASRLVLLRLQSGALEQVVHLPLRLLHTSNVH